MPAPRSIAPSSKAFGWLLVVALAGLPAARAFAQGAKAAETPEDRKEAAKLFHEGSRAYAHGDFTHAAQSFEAAYARAPRLPPLWNAARAWDRAGEPVRAANLYAAYLRKAPPSAPDRNSATAALRKIEPKLARLQVHAMDVQDVKIDGTAAADIAEDLSEVYVAPGSHVLEGTHAGKAVRVVQDAPAGVTTSVVLQAPPEAPPPTAPPPPQVHHPAHGGISPIFFFVGAGLTAVAGGLTIWSGVDTLGQRSTFDAAPTQANLDEGKSRQTRTNVFIGVTAGLAALTGVTAIFVDWKGHASRERAALRVVPGWGSLAVEGAF